VASRRVAGNRNACVTVGTAICNGSASFVVAGNQVSEELLRNGPTCVRLGRMAARTVHCSPACRRAAYRSRKKHQVERQRCMSCQVKNQVILPWDT